jgi:ubiquinone/menaquinone biosynthesis C-methylase UbiE
MAQSSTTQDQNGAHEYTMGHSKATIASHEVRTIESDAAFLVPYIQSHHRILDLGCGPGTITLGFIPLVPSGEVIGVDYSADIVERASVLAKSRGLSDKVTFVQGNLLERIPFEDASFDIIFASQVFGHLQPSGNAIKGLRECRRLLKTGGILALRDGAVMQFHPYGDELDRVFTKNFLRGTGAGRWGGPQFRGWLRGAGFDVEDEEKTKIGGGSTVHSSRKSCEWRCETLTGRLAKGEKFRESWLKAGISEEECDEAIEWLRKWAESDDAFYGLLQAEALVWK